MPSPSSSGCSTNLEDGRRHVALSFLQEQNSSLVSTWPGFDHGQCSHHGRRGGAAGAACASRHAGIRSADRGRSLLQPCVGDDRTVWAWRQRRGEASATAPPFLSLGAGGPILTGAIAIAAGARHGLAIKNDQSLWVWGSNTYGQHGDGMTNSHLTRVYLIRRPRLRPAPFIRSPSERTAHCGPGAATSLVSWPCHHGLPFCARANPHGVKAVAAGNSYSLAIMTDALLWAWGRNAYGQLGDADPVGSTPVQVLTDVKAVAARESHTLVI